MGGAALGFADALGILMGAHRMTCSWDGGSVERGYTAYWPETKPAVPGCGGVGTGPAEKEIPLESLLMKPLVSLGEVDIGCTMLVMFSCYHPAAQVVAPVRVDPVLGS